MATAAERFIEDLKGRGVRWIATLTGHGLDPLLDVARRAGLRLVDARNEQTASYMAEASGRLTREPAVCVVSSGIGLVNALSGAAAAWFDTTPMLLVSGAGELRTAGMGHYQDIDQAAVAAPLTKFSRTIDCPERTSELLAEALAQAEAYPPGPVHLVFPLDVQVGAGGSACPGQAKAPAPPAPAGVPPEEVARMLAAAERPLIIAGSGLYYRRTGAAFEDFLERSPIPCVAPIWDRGVVDRRLDAFLGVIGASSGGPRLLADADCIVMAGAVPDYRVGFLQPPAVRADARIVYFEGPWEWVDARSPAAWMQEARRRRDEFRRGVDARGAEHILNALRETLTDDACLLIDGGNIGQWAHQLLCDRYPPTWLSNGRSGAVGWGIGAAMGARLAYPEKPVVLLSGDGAFTFNLSDLESAVRQRLHFVALVADNQGFGIMEAGLGPVDFARAAESLGARGVRVARPEEIRPALTEALGQAAVTVIHVPIEVGQAISPAGA